MPLLCGDNPLSNTVPSKFLRLTDTMLVGFQFPVELGRSYVAGKTLPQAYETALVLVGFSDRAPLAGISLPLETVRRINARFGQDTGSYTSVMLRAQDSQKVSSVAAAVKKMGPSASRPRFQR